MTKKIIAVDIDDVIADSTEAYRLMINKRMSVNLKPEHYMVQGPYWQYSEQVWSSNGLDVTKIPLEELEGQMISDQSHILPKDGAQKALAQLAHHG